MRRRALQLTLTAALLLLNHRAGADQDQSKKSADKFSSDVASTWFEELYDVIKMEGTAPPSASRIYGISAVALYEAVVPGAQRYRSLAGQLNDLGWVPQPRKNRRYHWPTVANATLAATIRGLFTSLKPESLDAFNDLELSFATRFRARLTERTYQRSVAHGQAVAEAILDWATSDGFSTLDNCHYVPAPVPGAWQPTPPSFNPTPLQPCWGQLRPMVLSTGAECPAPGHPAFSTDSGSQFFAAALEVYQTGVNLTDQQKTIASYWSDGAGQTGTPPGHWIAIVAQISRTHHLSLMASAEALARVGMAVHDAFIECWHTKYLYNLLRPVTYINKYIDPGWIPYIPTPAFPSYHSGHSTQSGAASKVLTDMFGNMPFTDTTHSDHGLVPPQGPRSFRSFNEAANEAAISRLYGGIHYRFDNDHGLGSGRCIGNLIRERVQFKK